MLKVQQAETMQFEQHGESYDYDNYVFEAITPMSRQDVTVNVDFKTNTISGDKVAYGSWFDIETDECIDFLKMLQPEQILRDFSHIIAKYESD